MSINSLGVNNFQYQQYMTEGMGAVNTNGYANAKAVDSTESEEAAGAQDSASVDNTTEEATEESDVPNFKAWGEEESKAVADEQTQVKDSAQGEAETAKAAEQKGQEDAKAMSSKTDEAKAQTENA